MVWAIHVRRMFSGQVAGRRPEGVGLHLRLEYLFACLLAMPSSHTMHGLGCNGGAHTHVAIRCTWWAVHGGAGVGAHSHTCSGDTLFQYLSLLLISSLTDAGVFLLGFFLGLAAPDPAVLGAPFA